MYGIRSAGAVLLALQYLIRYVRLTKTRRKDLVQCLVLAYRQVHILKAELPIAVITISRPVFFPILLFILVVVVTVVGRVIVFVLVLSAFIQWRFSIALVLDRCFREG